MTRTPKIHASPASASTPAPAPAQTPTLTVPPETPLFINRELSWLEFNRRVLHEACDVRTPLLERVRFLGIFTSNLDEFIMKRVGGLKRQLAAGVTRRSMDGMTARQQLSAIRTMLLPMLQEQTACFENDIRPTLARHGIVLATWKNLSKEEHQQAATYFLERVFPVLTPLAVDPGHPFPFISNLSTSLGIALRHPATGEHSFARVKIPQSLPQWIPLESMAKTQGLHRFISLQDLICRNLDRLFPEMDILHVLPFRVTRNADIERDEEDTDDLLEMIEEEIRRRRFEKIVRLEHGPATDPDLLQLLRRELEVTEDDIYAMPEVMDYTTLKLIADLDIPELHYTPWAPLTVPLFSDEKKDVFSAIRDHDILVNHPYEDFSASTERFIQTAADDPHVLAIKMALYRTGDESPFIRTLIRAAENDKQVVCLVEIKARFDEERNIYWAQTMEKAGIHVVYGLVGLKTHSKITLIIRDEQDSVRCYAHIGTGNYNTQTAKIYTDLGLLTCNPAITSDLLELFNYLTGCSLNRDYRKLLVAPINMRDRFLQLIEREIAHHQAGRPAHIIAKMNSLEDDVICRALYRASQAGIHIQLIVRGFCCLRPGIPELSEHIQVLSVIGRFLEHSRIFHFRNGKADPVDGDFYIGSADWMYRNLLARVEVITPIEGRNLRERCWEILRIMLNDQRQAWDMQADGSYRQCQGTDAADGTHAQLMHLTRKRYGL